MKKTTKKGTTQRKKQLIALGLGAMVVGSAGLVAANQHDAPTSGDMDSTEHEYGFDEDYDYDEFDAQEDAIWEKIDAIYQEHADEFDSLEEEADILFEELEAALVADNDSEILRTVKALWEKEKALEALEERTGMAELYEQLDELYEDEDWEDYDEYEFEDDEDFDDEYEEDIYDKFENSNDPEVQNILKQIDRLESRLESIEEKNEAQFEKLDREADNLFDQLIQAEQNGNQADANRIEGKLEALEAEYEQLEAKLGMDKIYDQIEALEEKLYNFEGD